ncbi:cupin domain-containing protein [Citrifermentans bremense]|uniref:cupin domain-containing protein n=1 Tax=Citrifermentans bremense TaxID=60035 RepID=UPI0003FC4143|nr:cupin domain-containing protein [Citrifermentans bremense]
MIKRILVLSVACVSFASVVTAAPKKQTVQPAKQVILAPDQLEWKSGPAELPTSQMAVLDGDPKKSGYFAVRLKLPAGTTIAPHFHEGVERVTVISGTVKLAMGKTPDNPTVLPAGSYFALAPRTVHNAWVDKETVLQIATNGPWSLKLVDQGEKKGK